MSRTGAWNWNQYVPRQFFPNDRLGNMLVKQVVLIIEDEFLIRMHAVEIVENAGYEVVVAANADEAIAVLEERPDIHIVFTDIEMPGSMNGLKLARFVRGRWPPIKIIATSGHVSVLSDELPDGSVFVPKPYLADQIVAALREVIGA